MIKSIKQKLHLEKLAKIRKGHKFPPEFGYKMKRNWEIKRKSLPIKEKECLKCSKKFYRTFYPPRKYFPNGVLESYSTFINRKYCSLYCARHSDEMRERFKSRKGSKAPNWKGGKLAEKRGYIFIWKPYHPLANKDGYIFEHRLVMEKKLGRFLTKKEVVHHINGIKNDNRPENLQIFINSGYHLNHHLIK